MIKEDVKLGKNTKIYEPVNLYGCDIGDETQIGAFVEIQKDAFIGNRVRIQSHTFICSGVFIEDDVFIGHGVMFINDRYPTIEKTRNKTWELEPIVVKRGASIGSNATILCGVTIGENAIIGAGSVVTKSVPANTTVKGNPAK
jgi:UDP-2-acetamido-3-amino-2,3-dideoxy-glucuronate N-acetyltransferase